VLNFRPDAPLAVAAVEAIRRGNLEALMRLLRDNPSLATARIGNSRTLLHVSTDWPGNFPNSAATVTALIASGAEVNARSAGGSTGDHPSPPRQRRSRSPARRAGSPRSPLCAGMTNEAPGLG
jgi:hypothetical protein